MYGPTAAGHEECARAAEAAIAEVRPVFPPVLVGLANQPLIPPDRLRAALATRADALAAQTAAVRRAAEAQRDAPDFVRALFGYSLTQLDAEQAWLSAYRASLHPEEN